MPQPLNSPVPADVLVVVQAYSADLFAYEHLASGLGKIRAYMALRLSAKRLDAAMFQASVAPLLPWLGQAARDAGIDLRTTWGDKQRRFVSEAILSACAAPAREEALPAAKSAGDVPAGQPEPAAPQPDYAAMKTALGLRPDVAVAGVDPQPGHGEVSVLPFADLRAAIVEAESNLHAAAQSGEAPYKSPGHEAACDRVRTIRHALNTYAEHREAQRKWRAEKARRRRPLRAIRSQTFLRVNRDPDGNGPRYA